MAENNAAGGEEQKPKKKLPIKTLMIILGVVLLEAGSFVAFKVFFSGPAPADATEAIVDTATATTKKMVEVLLVENFSVDNYVGGRARIVVTLAAVAKADELNSAALTAMVEANQTEIKDRIRTLVSSAQPDHIRDAHLQVIKREIKTSVDQIVGEGLIEEILLPTWQSYPVD